jgi:hypothetical protein
MALRVSTVSRRNRKAVVVVDVTRRAGRHLPPAGYERVRIRQRKSERVVIELAVSPLGDRMAGRAGGRR